MPGAVGAIDGPLFGEARVNLAGFVRVIVQQLDRGVVQQVRAHASGGVGSNGPQGPGKVLHVVVERAAFLRVEIGEFRQIRAVLPGEAGGQFREGLEAVERRMFLQRAGEVDLHHRIRGRSRRCRCGSGRGGVGRGLGAAAGGEAEAGGDHEGRERSVKGRKQGHGLIDTW